MNPNGRSQGPAASQAMVLWIIWVSILAGIVVLQFTLGRGLPLGTNAPSEKIQPIAMVAVGLIVVASLLRWLVLPRFAIVAQQLVVMVAGLSLSEGAAILGLFLISPHQPETKVTLFVLGLLSAAQFAPFYARSGPPTNLR